MDKDWNNLDLCPCFHLKVPYTTCHRYFLILMFGRRKNHFYSAQHVLQCLCFILRYSLGVWLNPQNLKKKNPAISGALILFPKSNKHYTDLNQIKLTNDRLPLWAQYDFPLKMVMTTWSSPPIRTCWASGDISKQSLRVCTSKHGDLAPGPNEDWEPLATWIL